MGLAMVPPTQPVLSYTGMFTRFAARKPLLSEGKFGRKASDRRERDCDQTSLG
jgi:hypothetical protein